jgi:predicted adenine nucleotide alpha hydrolase (AANH) superfamily ATPase
MLSDAPGKNRRVCRGARLSDLRHDSHRQPEIGRTLATEFGIEYLDRDFKKKAGFQRSVQLSREY